MNPEKDQLLRQLGELAARREAEANERSQVDDALRREMETPLDAEARRRIVRRLESEMADQSESRDRVAAGEPSRAQPWFRPSQSWLRLAAAATLILALGGLLYRGLYSGSTKDSGLSLPIYTLSLEGYSETQRGPEGATDPDPSIDSPTFAPGNRLTATLRPRVAASTPVEARLYVSRSEGWAAVENAQIEVSTLGGVRYEAVVGRDVAVDGRNETLMLVVGAQGRMPRPIELDAVASERGTVRTDAWEAWVFYCRVSTIE